MSANWPAPRGPDRYQALVEQFAVAQRMKKFGVRFDMRRAGQHVADSRNRARTFTQLFARETGLSESELGPSGAGQTAAVKNWFRRAGAPDVAFSRSGQKAAQFNAVALTTWARDYQGAKFATAAAALLGLRKAKTLQRFLKSYLAVAYRHAGRIHFGFNPMGTKGERWSSSESFSWRKHYGLLGDLRQYSLNAQNVPSKTIAFNFGDEKLPIMVSVRDCFIPDPGCVWIKWDYEALEARELAYITGAKLLLEWIRDKKDIHLQNARILFPEANIPADANKDDPRWALYRALAKPTVYALSYQWSKGDGKDEYPELWKQYKTACPDMDIRYFRQVVGRFFVAHKEVRPFQHSISDQINRTGYLQLPQTGRILYLPADSSGYNKGINYLMQSGGGALINRAIVKVDRFMVYERSHTALLLQVHDELDAQARESQAAYVEERVSELMQEPMQFGTICAGVPAKGAVGSNWSNGKDIR